MLLASDHVSAPNLCRMQRDEKRGRRRFRFRRGFSCENSDFKDNEESLSPILVFYACNQGLLLYFHSSRGKLIWVRKVQRVLAQHTAFVESLCCTCPRHERSVAGRCSPLQQLLPFFDSRRQLRPGSV